jgi:hypothetical protein
VGNWKLQATLTVHQPPQTQVWPDYDAIVATCCDAWNWLVAAPDRLASITRREWAKPVTN